MAQSNESIISSPKPSASITFYILRSIQLIFSIVVGAIWSYLFYQLMKDHQDVLGTFFFLAAIAFMSILIVTTTTAVYWFSGPQPPFGTVIISLILMALWVGNVTVLSHHMSGTLGSPCDLVHLNGSISITVCKLYKALFGLTIVTLFSFVASFVVDIVALWQATCGSVNQHTNDKERNLSADQC